MTLQLDNRAKDFGQSIKQNYFFERSTPKPVGMENIVEMDPTLLAQQRMLGTDTDKAADIAKEDSTAAVPPKSLLHTTAQLSQIGFFEKMDTIPALQLLEQARTITQNSNSRTGDFMQERKNRSESIARYSAEWHKKFTLSVACVVLFFIGAPLGAIIKKGGLGLPLVVSIFIFILYYVISTIGEKAVKQLSLTPFEGMWVSTLILIPFGLFLTIKAANDSKLFDKDWYIRFVRKLKNKFKRSEA